MTARTWRTPTVVLSCGEVILTVALGIRHNFGLYLQPMTVDLGIGREVFSFAIAIQNLVYGIAQPFTGMIADKFGTARVVVGGALLVRRGARPHVHVERGVGTESKCGRADRHRPWLQRFLDCVRRRSARRAGIQTYGSPRRRRCRRVVWPVRYLPYGQTLISNLGWHHALLVLAATVLIVVPLSTALVEDKQKQAKQQQFSQSIPEAMREAFSHRGYVLLCTAYTVCGFQLMFISVHFPAYLLDQHMSAQTGMTALALVGLFNIFGSYIWGWLGGRYTKKYLLSALYFTRAVAIAFFIAAPLSPLSIYTFAAVIAFCGSERCH